MKGKILVAEDDQAIVEVMKIILQDADYTVFTADNSININHILTYEMPHLILLDIWLSGENGGDIAHSIRNNESTKHIPVIMVSANNETEKIAKEVGAVDFLQKPFNIEDLLAAVAKHIKSS